MSYRLNLFIRKTLLIILSDNVTVIYPKFVPLPPLECFRRKLGDYLAWIVNRTIIKRKIHFDLIHAHFTWKNGYIGVKLGNLYKRPTILTVHENRDWLLEEYKSKDENIYWAWKNASAIIRVNRADIPMLRKFNSNVFYIPNGYSPKRLPLIEKDKARSHLGLHLDAKILFSLGALIERKGFQYLIEALYLIAKERDDIICYIGGRGPFKDKLQEQIDNFSLQKNVKLLGFVPEEKLKYWMNAADMFVLPSLSEGNPTVMFEALGVGLPFIGTTVGGIPEIIHSGDYGLLCPPADPECLAEKILIALEKEWDRRKIRKYAEQFTWENIVKKIVWIYSRLLGDESD